VPAVSNARLLSAPACREGRLIIHAEEPHLSGSDAGGIGIDALCVRSINGAAGGFGRSDCPNQRFRASISVA
jgi:hypothetical protein